MLWFDFHYHQWEPYSDRLDLSPFHRIWSDIAHLTQRVLYAQACKNSDVENKLQYRLVSLSERLAAPTKPCCPGCLHRKANTTKCVVLWKQFDRLLHRCVDVSMDMLQMLSSISLGQLWDFLLDISFEREMQNYHNIVNLKSKEVLGSNGKYFLFDT